MEPKRVSLIIPIISIAVIAFMLGIPATNPFFTITQMPATAAYRALICVIASAGIVCYLRSLPAMRGVINSMLLILLYLVGFSIAVRLFLYANPFSIVGGLVFIMLPFKIHNVIKERMIHAKEHILMHSQNDVTPKIKQP